MVPAESGPSLYFFYVYMCFAWCMCLFTICLVPVRMEEGSEPWNWSYGKLWSKLLVQRTKPGPLQESKVHLAVELSLQCWGPYLIREQGLLAGSHALPCFTILLRVISDRWSSRQNSLGKVHFRKKTMKTKAGACQHTSLSLISFSQQLRKRH